MTHWPLLSEERKTLDGLFQFHRFQSRFAIRLAVVLCLSFTFVYLTQWPFAYWYPMTVFLMLMPYAEESAARINNRVLGNLLGLLMTALLLSLFHSLPAYVFLVALMTCLMYYVPLTSTSMSTYGTCYGMILAILLVDIRLAIGLRLAYVAMAAGQPPNPVGNRRPDAGGTAGNALLQQQPALLSPVSDSEQYAHPRNGDPPGGKPQYSGPHPPSPSAPPSA